MSQFPVYNFVAVPYQGAFYGVPVSLCTQAPISIQGQIQTPGHQSKVIALAFDWVNVYSSQAVLVNLQSQSTTAPLDQVTMVYIDNSENPNTITIVVPDSQQVITVQPFANGYFPVLTSGFLFTVYNGITGIGVSVGSTNILVCNFAIPGFLAALGKGVVTLFTGFVNITSSTSFFLTGTSGSITLTNLDAAIEALTPSGMNLLCAGELQFATSSDGVTFTTFALMRPGFYSASNTGTAVAGAIVGFPLNLNWNNGLMLPRNTTIYVIATLTNVTNIVIRANLYGYNSS